MLEVIDHAGLGVLMQSKEGIDYDAAAKKKCFSQFSSMTRVSHELLASTDFIHA